MTRSSQGGSRFLQRPHWSLLGRTVLRTGIAALMLGAATPANAQHDLAPLEADEGYLVVGIDIKNIFWVNIAIDRDGTLGDAHRINTDGLQTELMYEIVRLPAGTYHWKRMELKNHSWFSLEEHDFPMKVEAGRINYGGRFVGRGRANGRASFEVLNRASAAIRYLEDCCHELLARYPLQSGAIDEDPFVEYYASLTNTSTSEAQETPESITDDEAAAEDDPGAELVATLIRDFYRRNKYAEPKLSPDGRFVVAFEQIDGERNLVLLDPVHEYKHSIIAEGTSAGAAGLELHDMQWIDNDDIVFTYSLWGRDRMANAKITLQDDTSVHVALKVLGEGWYLVDPLVLREDRAAVVVYLNGLPNLHIIDVNESEKQVFGVRNQGLQNKINSTFLWNLTTGGRVRAAVGVDEENLTKTLWYRTSESNTWRDIWTGDMEITMIPVLIGDDDRTLTVITNEHSDHTLITTYDRKTKTYGETIFEVAGSDVESVTVDASKTRIIRATTTQDGLIRHHYMGDALAVYPQLLDVEIYGSEPYIIDQSIDGRRAIVQTSTADRPGAYFLLDVDERLSYRFGELRPWLSNYRLGSSQPITAYGTDGLQIQSFLTLPDPEKFPEPPLIVMPHGGPISVQDRQHFNATVQTLASLGYAVLRTNYRGSGGYGKSFEAKGERQWGRMIEDDIEAALDAVVAMDVVDESKVCIFGASYGGYSALISAIRSPGRYRCAASYAGVTDLPLIFHAFRVNRSNVIRSVVERIVGNPEEELPAMIQHSPVFRADQIQVPVLLYHGEKDETVDVEHFERMVAVLKHFEKDVEYGTFANEGHGFKYLESAVSFHLALDRFFRRALDLPPPEADKVLRDHTTAQRESASELVQGP